MKRYKLSEAGERGWFIGDFEKAVLRTKDFEVAYQHNQIGNTRSHYHRQAVEITLIITGRVLMNGQVFEQGEIIVLEPGDISQLEYLEETRLVTIKSPSVPNDKFYL